MNILGVSNIETIYFGPDENIFYDNFDIRDNLIIIPCREQEMKGTSLVVPLIQVLKGQGWKVIGYGDLKDPLIVSLFDEFKGRISRKEVAKLMQRSKILLDFSVFEGLGLTPIEASMCGCFPIISYRGGIQSLPIENSNNTLWFTLENTIDLGNIMQVIANVNKTISLDSRKLNQLIYM